MIEDADLGEQRGLIPIEMLMGHFAVLKLDEATKANSTLRPVAGTPGSIQSISSECVKH